MNILVYYSLLKKFANWLDPNCKYTSITLNKNFQTSPHYDANNIGTSMIIGLGPYTGGELVVNELVIDIHEKVHYFDGSLLKHHTLPFEGTRYSIVYHTRHVINMVSDYKASCTYSN